MYKSNINNNMRMLLAVVLSAVMVACASIGRPEGGPRDTEPPVFVRSNPAPGSVNVSKQTIELYFDENLKIDDATNKVVVSPAQKVTPQVIANGKRLSVELKDTLQTSTTYIIDFSDAITDLNEGNALDGFTYDFATGDCIDTLRISGMLFEARTLEPAQGVLVGCYSNLSDTAITTIPMQRIAKTNQYGQFTIKGLKEGQYRVFAINDMNRDYMWDRSEDVAFYDSIVTPSVHSIEVVDTLLSSSGSDSISTRQGVKYLPNDILLTWFNENYQSQYLKNYSRPDSARIFVQFAAKSDSLPVLEIVNGKNKGKKIDSTTSILNSPLTLDSLEYWITDKDIISQDTMQIALKYLHTDSLDNLSWTTDTLKFNFTRKKVKEKKKKKEDADTVPEIVFMDFACQSAMSQDLNKGLEFVASQPVASFNADGIRLEMQRDSTWIKMPGFKLVNDTVYSPLKFKADYDWEEGMKYRFTADSAAIKGIYGNWNKSVKHEFTVKTIEDYGTMTFVISGGAKNFVVELLDGNDRVLQQQPVKAGEAVFEYLDPGKYYVRGYIDANGNGVWDTGNLKEKIQPEEVYYYPKKIDLKKNWEIEQQWNPFELPIDAQKPLEIKKNKPKKKKGEQDQTNPDDENSEEDQWGDSYYNPNNPYGANGNSSNNRNRNRNSGFNGMSNGSRY